MKKIVTISSIILLLLINVSFAQESNLAITDMKVEPAIINPGGNALISCRVSHSKGPQCIKSVAATAFYDKWVTTYPNLYDDGTKGDNVPEDGVFSLTISVKNPPCVAKIIFHAVDTDKQEIESDPIFLTIK